MSEMREKQSAALLRLLDVMDRLRAECPWDREQTFLSLRNNTIEEVYELVDAIVGGDMDEIRKELGDVLLHVVFYSKIASEQGAFDIADVADALCDKLIYRHPHVFGQIDASTSEQVSRNWEQLKLREKDRKKEGVLAGVPSSLPAMIKAYRISQKAASAGFEWKSREDVWEKVREELAEVEAEMRAGRHEAMEQEFGDAMFALINAARMYGVDPELALEHSNRKFIDRFRHIEQGADRRGVALNDMSLEQMEELWQEAKQGENV
ncbi:nucleoside triphosphate pyrophosphohydrolase [Bacteroidia bacterium]|nr:nucleoside triphosphate pyrophosphohydrolase [Bacteroidia bacterium]